MSSRCQLVSGVALAAAFVTLTPRAGSAADPQPAVPGVVYATLGNNGSNPGALITINPATGAGTLLGPTGILGPLNDAGVPALAIRSTGEILAMEIGPAARLYQLDAATGAATLVAPTSLSSPPAIAFDGSDVLWAVDNAGKLYTLDDVTGASVLVGSTGAFIKALAVDPISGALWGSDASSAMFTIDTQTGAATFVGNTGLPPTADIYFDAAGTLYGSSGGGFAINNLITIDESTGAGVVIGSIGFASVSGMATRHERFVPVALQAYDAAWMDGRVVVTWRLIDMQGAISFDLFRADGAAPFKGIETANVVEAHGEFVYVDDTTEPAHDYRYRVVVFEDGDPVTSFEESVSTPGLAISLEQNHPNPFNPTTRIAFTTGSTGPVSLKIFDGAGRLVHTLVDRELPPGTFTETWNGRNADGQAVASGVYFYQLTAGKQVLTRKAVLLK